MLRLLICLLLAGCTSPPDEDLAPVAVFSPPALNATYALGETGPLTRLRVHNQGEEPFRIEAASLTDPRLDVVHLMGQGRLVPAGGFTDLEVVAGAPLPILGFEDVLHLEIAPVGRRSREFPWPHDVPVALGLSCDADGDGAAAVSCGGLDCDDLDPHRHPGASEVCDGVDQDCLGLEDESDADADGWFPCNGDCDDLLSGVNPGAEELCDGVDTDCVGGPALDEVDADGDGVPACDSDCDDSDPEVRRPGEEICNDRDDDCDGLVDEDSVRIPEDFFSISEALAASDGPVEICLIQGTWVTSEPWSHDRSHVVIRGRGPGISTINTSLREGDEPQLSMVEGYLGLHNLRFRGHQPMLHSEGGFLDLRNVVVVATETTSTTAFEPIINALDTYVDVVGLEVRSTGPNWTLVPAVQVEGGAFLADDVLIEDYIGVQPIIRVDDVSQGLLSNVVSRRNHMVFGDTTPVIRLVGDSVGIRGLHATDNVGTEVAMANGGGFFAPRGYLRDVVRRGGEGPLLRWYQGRGELTRFDVRAPVGSQTSLVRFSSSGSVAATAGILAGGFTAAGEFSPAGDASFSLDNVTVVSSPGSDGVLATNLAGPSTLELRGSTVSLEGAASRWRASSPQTGQPSLWALGSNLDVGEPIALDPGSDSNLAVWPGFVDVSSPDPYAWDLHLFEGSPLLFHPGSSLSNPDGTDAHIGAYGGEFAGSYDFDGDGAVQHWHGGAFTPEDALEGRDCDDTDPEVFGLDGCGSAL